MKKTLLLTLFVVIGIQLFAQSNNFVLIGNYLTKKTKKIMLYQNYDMVLSDDYLLTKSEAFVKQYKSDGFYNAKLTSANLNSFYFNDSIEIPFEDIKTIASNGKSHRTRSVILILGLTAFGTINYFLLRDNVPFYQGVLINLFTGILPLNIGLLSTNFNSEFVLKNHEILEIRNIKRSVRVF